MAVLSITKKQEEKLYLLRLEGLRRELELHEATEAYEKALETEKEVLQYVIDHHEFFVSPENDLSEHGGPKAGDRIIDEFDICLVDEKIFTEVYLPKVRQTFMDLFGIDNPLNFVYSSPMRERKLKAENSYYLLAVDFLRICGHEEEAAKIEKAVRGYLKPEFKKRLKDLNDNFIYGEKKEE